MAQRRMLNINMISSDEFSKLSQAAQLLYIHLNMTADDDGMVGNPEKLMRSLMIRKQNLDTLLEKGYIIRFESGVVAVRHWHQHNYIRSDRYTKTRYITELSQLKLNADSTYEFLDFTEKTGVFGQPNNGVWGTQCSVGKDSIIKDRIDKDSIVQCSVDKVNEVEDNKVQSSVGDVSLFEKIEEEKRAEQKTEQFTNELITKEQTTKEQITNEQTEIDNDDDFFDFEEIEVFNENVITCAEYSMTNNSHDLSHYMSTLTEKQKDRYKSFLLNIYIYLCLNKIKINAGAFIKYNEERMWLGRGGESVIKNYKKYIDAWEKNDYASNKKKF